MYNYTVTQQYVSHKSYDEDLRKYFIGIYSLMSIALCLTALSAFAIYYFPDLNRIIFNIGPNGHVQGMTALGLTLSLAPIAIALYFAFGAKEITIQTAKVLLWIYAALTGVSLSVLGFIYTEMSIIKTFFICASIFASMSLYGYTTNKDLTSFGSFLTMGLLGLVISSLVNIFLKSPAMDFVISLLGVGVFTGLIAFDTQNLKAIYYAKGKKASVMGAFILYLDFINLFLHLIKFLGIRKEDE